MLRDIKAFRGFFFMASLITALAIGVLHNCQPALSQANSSFSRIDKQFLRSYRRTLMRMPSSTKSEALTQLQQDPQKMITQAKVVCTDLSSGMPREQVEPKGTPEADVFKSLASHYYCPNATVN
jgi:Protein of unknown function (DUF732)